MNKTNFNGEFGWELLKAIPYAYSIHLKGLPLKTISCADTKCLYYFSKNHEERYKKRSGMSGTHWDSPLPFNTIHRRRAPEGEWWTPPPYKEVYKNTIKQEKPGVVISNKYNMEWGKPPINYISKKGIVEMVETLKSRYKVYYNRPIGIIADNSKTFDLGEKDEAKKAGAILLEEEYENQRDSMTFNQFQMAVLASCDKFVSVQGGTSILSSYFGGTNLILAKAGQELKHNSYSWYKRLSGCKVKVFREEKKIIESLA
jgi:hypothetical protein